MKFFCDQCNAQYMIGDEKVGPRGVKVKCKKCANIILVKPLLSGESTTVDKAALPPEPTPQPAAPTPQKTELSGAFDSLFSGEDTNKGAAGAWSNQSTTVMQSPPAGVAAGEKEWYVAIEDSQVGPIDLAELQQRWDGREISEESLAWKAGMPDWVAICEIPDLAHLIRDRPQKKSGASASPTTTAGAAAANKSAAAIEWKPSAASALSSLVQEELIAAASPKEAAPASKPEGVPDLGGLPAYGANDLFGGKVGGAAPPANEGFSGGPNWSVPSGRPASGGHKPLYIILGGVAVMLLALLGVMAFFIVKGQQTPAQVAVAPTPAHPQAVAPTSPTTPAPAPAPTAAAPQAAPAATPPAAAAAAQGSDEGDDEGDDKKGGHHKKHKAKEHLAHDEGSGGGRAAPATPPPAAPATPPAGPVKASLSKEDIWSVVRQNASKAAPCLKAARTKNEITAGSYTFTLDWVIRPDGGVAGPQLKGPANVMGSSLPACFSAVVAQWHFPASQAGAPIRNFPFGPINVP